MNWLLATLLLLLPLEAGSAAPINWHGRSIYFVVTDRFAKDADDSAEPCFGSGWCGGTFKGVERKLDYIEGMGFDAIWITPVVKQVEWRDTNNGTGFHGYWAGDFSKIEPHLGTESDLLSLSRACKKRGMLLMVDVVANHVGPIDDLEEASQLAPPFNSHFSKRFHLLGRKKGETFKSYLSHPLNACSTNCMPGNFTCEGYNEMILQQGWFWDLGDLRQEDAETRSFLLSWIRDLVQKFELDGLRLDTALYMPQWFLSDFQRSAGVYIVGEVTTYNFSYHSSFQGPLDGLLNFPITMRLNGIFNKSGSLVDLQHLLLEQGKGHYNDEHLLANFVDNHDGPRFLPSHKGDIAQLQNALVWAMLHHGIPIVYYGTEQPEVSLQEDNRFSMWPHFRRGDLYNLLRRLNRIRREYGLASGGDSVTVPARTLVATEDAMVFRRGDLLVAITNVGSNPTRVPRACIPFASLPMRWMAACDIRLGSSAAVREVLWEGAPPRCQSDRLCIELHHGRPSILSLVEVARYV